MCGGGGSAPAPQPVQRIDPKVAADEAAAEAASKANADAAARRDQVRKSALATGAGNQTSALSYGKATLGA